MKSKINTALAAILLLAISCKKESKTLQSFRITDKSSTDVVTGITGKYASIKIGAQKWMTKNLDVTHYRNGDKIPYVKGKAAWAALTTGAWCWYNNDSANGAVYGKLYNWYAVNDPRGLAPTGWHVPSRAEWDTLSTFLGGEFAAGGKLKDTGTIEAGTGLWYAPNTGATNSSGFTALPGGGRADGAFRNIGLTASFWSSTQYGAMEAGYFYMTTYYGFTYNYNRPMQDGHYVRCIRD